jgi:hypothetical protein
MLGISFNEQWHGTKGMNHEQNKDEENPKLCKLHESRWD